MNNSKLQEKFFLYFPSNFYMFNSFFGYEVIGVNTLGDGKKEYAPAHYTILPDRFISVLSKRSEKEQRDFWYLRFNLYDAPTNADVKPLEKIKTLNKRSYDIMISELKKSQERRRTFQIYSL
jgi:hypothetical protein